MKTKNLTQDQILMDTFRFNMRDLHANREGYITKSQRTKILRRDTGALVRILSMFIVLAFLAMMGLLIDFIVSTRFGITDAVLIYLLAFSGLITIITFPYWLYMTYALRGARVESVQGIIVLDTSPQRAMVKIGRLKLRAHRDALLTLKHMSPYVIHYLPKSKIIVSVETIES